MRRLARALHADELGQSMVVVALSVVVLLGALALAVDWGYGLTQRRVLQSAADAAALGAGRYLATSVVEIEGSTAFAVHGEDVWCEAARFVEANDPFRPAGAQPTFTMQFGSDANPIVWIDAAEPPGGTCPATGSAQVVPSDTIYVRVAVEMTYRSLVASVVGAPDIRAAASARAKLSGTPVTMIGPVWPMVRHYDRDDYDNPCPPMTCDPTELPPTTFWSSNEPNVVYGSFKGLIDPSRFSTRFESGDVPQLIDGWDMTGTDDIVPPTGLKPDQSGNCPAGWDTAGNEDPQQQDKRCSIPNWFYYSFQGTLSLDTIWAGANLPAGQETPTVLPTREVCAEGNAPELAPSCDAPLKGDWVETAPSGDLGVNVSPNMRALIEREGFLTPFSDRAVIDKNGRPTGETYGKALVVLVFLWDCGESWNKNGADGDQWDPIPADGSDCSNVPSTGNARTPDRVHLFTAAPFTFYEGLVDTQEVRGYWGGAFATATLCQDCPLNPLSNTAFLVPDD